MWEVRFVSHGTDAIISRGISVEGCVPTKARVLDVWLVSPSLRMVTVTLQTVGATGMDVVLDTLVKV